MPDTQKLNYAPSLPMHRRQVFRRWSYAAMLLGVLASGWWWAPPAWRRVQLLYWQHRCMVYIPSENQAVIEPHKPFARPPEEWSNFYDLVSPPGAPSFPALFMHEMQTPNGRTRLAVVDVGLFPNGGLGPISRVFIPATFHSSAIEGPYSGKWTWDDTHQDFKIYAGTIDPADSTHFTFRTELKGQQSVYDGWLQNDDSLIIGERKMITTSK